jgi:16S rRNA (cytosine1402-N4)-methyltransferase
MASANEHVPVLAKEVLDGLAIGPGQRHIDATIGGGGHAYAILEASAPDGQLLGIDADPEAITWVQSSLRPFGNRVILRTANFRDLKSTATSVGFCAVDGILLDLGVSSRQLDAASRGFSFSQDGPLDMRLDPSQGHSAQELVNNLTEMELARLLWEYGEERHSRQIARAIVAARPVHTTGQLAALVAKTIGRTEKIHPATRTFLALRIAVNDELESLAQSLPQARDLLRRGGRLAIISFHSLEDRIAKRFLQQEARDCICPPETPACVCGHRATLRAITRKPIRPSDAEVASNPRSRSARLRIAQRL